MTNTERLVEAAIYAEDNGLDWWDVFDSPSEAMKVIKSALREEPEEGQVVCLLSATGLDENIFESHTAYEAYRNALKTMRQELKEYLD